MLRVLLVARDHMTDERTRAINTLTALLRTVELGMDAHKPLTAAQLTTITGRRDREENLAQRTCRAEATRLARRIRTLNVDLATVSAISTTTASGSSCTAASPVNRPGVSRTCIWQHVSALCI